jgi:hypothetical protein
MYYKRVLLGKGMLLFPVLAISATPPALMTVFRFCWKRMVLGAQLITKTTNKSTTYYQRFTVSFYNEYRNLLQLYELRKADAALIPQQTL